VTIIGELANFRISKNKWVYFDLKDEFSNLRFFGTVFSLKGPLEDGMLLKVVCSPRMHRVYGFSMQIQSIELVGEGSLKRAAELLQTKLTKEGIFDIDKKRSLPYPPSSVALVTSSQSAAYHDFVKVINQRWRGLNIDLIDVQVQGEPAIGQIIEAITKFNKQPDKYQVMVIIRGGGSAEDLAAFSSEAVTRAVASSIIPTLVAIGHEIDISLSELAADRRASTPSNAAELLVPDKKVILSSLNNSRSYLNKRIKESLGQMIEGVRQRLLVISNLSTLRVNGLVTDLSHQKQLLSAYNPNDVLKRGYSIVRKQGKVIRSASSLAITDKLDINFAVGSAVSEVKSINKD
jgi:exodeoxyribonuclease VII large subunit